MHTEHFQYIFSKFKSMYFPKSFRRCNLLTIFTRSAPLALDSCHAPAVVATHKSQYHQAISQTHWQICTCRGLTSPILEILRQADTYLSDTFAARACKMRQKLKQSTWAKIHKQNLLRLSLPLTVQWDWHEASGLVARWHAMWHTDATADSQAGASHRYT